MADATFEHVYVLGGPDGAQRVDGVPHDTAAGPTWLDVNRTNEAGTTWLRKDAGLDGLVAEALLAGATRPRVERHGGGALVALRGVNLNPGADPEDMISIRMWIEPHRLITVHRERLLSIDDVRGELDAGRGPRSVGGLVAAVVSRLTTRVEPVVESIEDRLDDFEDQVLLERGELEGGELASLRHEIISMHRYLAPQVHALQALDEPEHDVLDERARRSLRETTNRVRRCVEDLDAARSRASILQDEVTNRLAGQLNHRMYAITIIAGVFLPLTFITGLLGINVGGIPGSSNPAAFAVVTGALVVLGGLCFWIARRAKWL